MSVPPHDAGALAVVLGNLGVVCHEQGDADQAVDALEASLQIASSIVAAKPERYKRWRWVDVEILALVWRSNITEGNVETLFLPTIILYNYYIMSRSSSPERSIEICCV